MLKEPDLVAVSLGEGSSHGLVGCVDHEMFEGGRHAMTFFGSGPGLAPHGHARPMSCVAFWLTPEASVESRMMEGA